LKHESKSQFCTFFRWGRVGTPGKSSTKSFGSASKAIALFNKKLSDKMYKSGYTEIEIVYEDEPTEEETAERMKNAFKSSKLPAEVNELVNLIFDTKLITKCMSAIGYDAKKMPLGKLSNNNIDKAYQQLTHLMTEVKKSKPSTYQLEYYSSQFYTLIPHNFGFKHMSNFIINTEKKVQEKLDFLDTLKNMKITKSMTESVDDKAANILEANYKKLKCDIDPIAQDSKAWKLIDKFLQTSNPSGHRYYDITLENAYELQRDGELNRFDKHNKNIDNKRLLWHGSRLTNFVGIISQGLRIAPPSAPVSGYNFGKGVYFADMIAKSSCYCRAETSDMTAMILLCEVACGNPSKHSNFNYNAGNLPSGTQSTLGLGRTFPDPKNEEMLDGAIVPMGPPHVGGDGQTRGISYDEWIVYNVNQIKMKYLLKCKFKKYSRW
jgi:poly [ADP-ribose] polymerase